MCDKEKGEPLDEDEFAYLLQLAQDSNPSDPNSDECDIQLLAKILLPSDNILEELTH